MKLLSWLFTNVVLNPIVLLCMALPAGIVGGMLVYDSPSYTTRGAQAEQLSPVTVAALADRVPGSEVLLEGSVSSQNQAVYHDFVAYVREEYRSELLDFNKNQHWVEVARVTPPLAITLPDGEARISNTSYALDSTAMTVRESEPTLTKGAIQLRGFVAGNPMLAIGKVNADGTIDAELVYAGTRAAYIAEMQRTANNLLPIGVIFLVCCALFVVTGVWQLRRFVREMSAEQAREQAA